MKEKEVIKENSKKMGEIRARMNELEFELGMLSRQYSELTKINNGIRGQMALKDAN